jgi:tetratricopeptide (TPR) repeat protein
MFMLADGYADKFPRFLERVSALGSTQAAFAEVYGKSTAEIERDMTVYFRQNVQSGAVYRAAEAKFEIGETRQASGTEVGIALANLTTHLGRTMEARKRLKELAAQYPGNADIESARGSLEEMAGEQDAAMAIYRSAVALHPAGWNIYWNHARLLDEMGGELDPRLQDLEDALERNTGLTEARLRLGRDL